MKHILLLLVGTLVFFMFSCESETTESKDMDDSVDKKSDKAVEQPVEVKSSNDSDEDISYEEKKISGFKPVRFAKMIAERISQRNFNDWGNFSSSLVFFSPYAHIEQEKLIYLGANYLQEHYESDEVFNWGVQDGTGDSIKLTFHDYIDRYVADFSLMGEGVIFKEVDTPQSRGNEVHNVQDVFPNSIFVEIHKPADDDMGMNWRSLILVLNEVEGRLRLEGLVHNEWTI